MCPLLDLLLIVSPFTGYFVVCPLPGNCVPFARSLLKVCHLIDLCYLCALRSIFVNWVAFVRTLLTVCPLLDLSRTLKKMGTTHDLLSIYLPYRPGFETVIFQLNDLTTTPKVKKKAKKKKKQENQVHGHTHIPYHPTGLNVAKNLFLISQQ